MKTDDRLKTLCEEFTNLEETEKDYILGVSQALAHSVFEKGAIPLPVGGVYQEGNQKTYVQYEENLT